MLSSLFNNCVFLCFNPSLLILSSINLPLVFDTDNILNTIHTFQQISDIFKILQAEYQRIVSQFNSANLISSILMRKQSVCLDDHLIHLGLPIDPSIRHTYKILLGQCIHQISTALLTTNFDLTGYFLLAFTGSLQSLTCCKLLPFENCSAENQIHLSLIC